MQQSFFGELFGVKVYLPVSRNEVNELVIAKSDLAQKLAQQKSIPLHQVHIQLDMEVHDFIHEMDKIEAVRFYEYLIEESADSKESNAESEKGIPLINEEIILSDGSSHQMRNKLSIFSLISGFLLVACIVLTIYWFGLSDHWIT